jgi:hypothetical protein
MRMPYYHERCSALDYLKTPSHSVFHVLCLLPTSTAARRKLRHDTASDALVLLRAAGAYAHAIKGGECVDAALPFCRKLGLHAPTMDRLSLLKLKLNL